MLDTISKPSCLWIRTVVALGAAGAAGAGGCDRHLQILQSLVLKLSSLNTIPPHSKRGKNVDVKVLCNVVFDMHCYATMLLQSYPDH